MKKGFRVAPQPSKHEAMNELKAEFANLQMAGRVSPGHVPCDKPVGFQPS